MINALAVGAPLLIPLERLQCCPDWTNGMEGVAKGKDRKRDEEKERD